MKWTRFGGGCALPFEQTTIHIYIYIYIYIVRTDAVLALVERTCSHGPQAPLDLLLRGDRRQHRSEVFVGQLSLRLHPGVLRTGAGVPVPRFLAGLAHVGLRRPRPNAGNDNDNDNNDNSDNNDNNTNTHTIHDYASNNNDTQHQS